MREQNEKAVQAMRAFLEALGLDLEQCSMERTPERVARLYGDLFDGLGKDPASIWGERFASETKGIVAVRHIPFHSVCEHHLLPFFGEVSLAYLPHDGQVAGFSKFVKLVECFAHRPQLQERLTREVAETVMRGLAADGVLVVCRAHQFCMALREGGTHDTLTTTSEALGALAEPALAAQAWALLGGAGKEDA